MPTKFSYPRPDWVRRINYMGDSVGGAEQLVSLDPDEMLKVATATTGLDDFGDHWGDDWRAAYYKLVETYQDNGQLHTVGRLATRHEMVRTLRTRLLLVHEHKQKPELAEVEIKEPVFIVGQSRTGTTIIHELLGLDPNRRALLGWESIHPLELQDAPDTPRAILAECEQDLFENIVPEFAAVHELRAAIPMECVLPMALEFSGGWAATTASVDEFLVWRSGTDPLPSYQMHKRFLQVLQGTNDDTRWLLKSPAHLMQLPVLFEVYPDAKIIHTHRDPVKTVASTISTVATSRYARSDHVNTEALAFSIPIGFQMALEAGIAYREQGTVPAKQVADVLYHEFMADPVKALSLAYKQLDLPFLDTLGQSMQDYLRAKPQGKHGLHRYSLQDFGLDEDAIRTQFAQYVQHYGIQEGV